jgi:hypothetical protein
VHGDQENQIGVPAALWAQRLGQAHFARDESAARIAKSQNEDASDVAAVSVGRWAAIVDAMRRLADGYNAGARRVVLSVVAESEQPTVTVTAADHGSRLTAALEDSVISVQARDARGATRAAAVRLRPDRDDEATAAYVLQDWMQHL